MYIEDKEKFMQEWKRLADNWYRRDKRGARFSRLFMAYTGPRSMGFYRGLVSHLYDDWLTPEAREFFYDNLENPHMKNLYPFSSLFSPASE